MTLSYSLWFGPVCLHSIFFSTSSQGIVLRCATSASPENLLQIVFSGLIQTQRIRNPGAEKFKYTEQNEKFNREYQ